MGYGYWNEKCYIRVQNYKDAEGSIPMPNHHLKLRESLTRSWLFHAKTTLLRFLSSFIILMLHTLLDVQSSSAPKRFGLRISKRSTLIKFLVTAPQRAKFLRRNSQNSLRTAWNGELDRCMRTVTLRSILTLSLNQMTIALTMMC